LFEATPRVPLKHLQQRRIGRQHACRQRRSGIHDGVLGLIETDHGAQQPRMFDDGRWCGMLEGHGDRHRRPRRHPPEREHDAGSHGLDDLAR